MPESAVPSTERPITDLSTKNVIPDNSFSSFEDSVFGGPNTPPPTDNSKPATTNTNQPPAKPQVNVAPDNNTDKGNDKTGDKVTPPNLAEFNKLLSGDSFIKTANPPSDKAGDKDKDKDKVQTQQTQQQTDSGKPQRNLEGFGEREQTWLQRMPYEAYEYFSKELRDKRKIENEFVEKSKTYEKQITDLQAGKQQIPANYYENPAAAYLLPEVNKLQNDIQLAATVENHWTEQLNLIEEGLAAKARGEAFDKKWYSLGQDKEGELILANEHEVNTNARAYVLKQIANSSYHAQQARAQLNSTVANHKQHYNSLVSTVNETAKKFFPIFQDPKNEEYKVLEQTRPEILKLGITKENPAFELLAQSAAFNYILRNMILSMMNNTSTQQAIQQDKTKAGPNGSDFSSVDTVKPTATPVSLNDYNKLL